jgi:hypothetical protein
MVTVAGFGKSLGAVKSPALDMVPTIELPPGTPLTLQVTTIFDVPVTVAVSCCVLPSNTLEIDDETITVTDRVDELLPPPQPPKPMRKVSEQKSATTAVPHVQEKGRAGKGTRSPCLALVSVMMSSIH